MDPEQNALEDSFLDSTEESPSFRGFVHIPSAVLIFKRLINIWPDVDVKVVPQFVRATVGLLVSNLIFGQTLRFLYLKPSILWFGVVFLLVESRWSTPLIYQPSCWFNLGSYLRNAQKSGISCIVGFVFFIVYLLIFLKCLLESDIRYSSVWCSKQHHQLRTCHFRNIYYDVNHGFLFLLDESSVISGIHSFEEFKQLKMSPIADHKGVNMKIMMVRSLDDVSILSSMVLKTFKFSNIFHDFVTFIEEPYFALYRFKPDNFMHVIHDDLVPLFFKFRELSAGNVSQTVSYMNLFFTDMNDHGPFVEWYHALSSSTPLLTKDMLHQKLYCFSSMYMGASNTSFFQYGFDKPQGPVKPNLDGRDIAEFKKYYMKYFGVVSERIENTIRVTLISRKNTRKISNEDKISSILSTLVKNSFDNHTTLVISKVDLISNKNEILKFIASSDIVIGMHGAEAILSLFLPDSSVFIEMFPFGIYRDNVSPVFSLSRAVGVNFRYLSWHNVNEKNSIIHPEYPKELGGIAEFPAVSKKEILNIKLLPAVSCCGNPAYLFRMYQDTIIDDSFSQVVLAALELLKSKNAAMSAESKWFFPGPVLNLKCHRHTDHVNVSWAAPINVVSLITYYDVSVLADLFHHNFVTSELIFRVDLGDVFQDVQVWVSSQFAGKQSVDSYSECHWI